MATDEPQTTAPPPAPKPQRQRDRWVWVLLLGGAALATALILTPLRFILWGAVRGEAFYDGKPTCYWEHELNDDEGSSTAYQELLNGRGAAVAVLNATLQSETLKVRRAGASILGHVGPEAAPTALDLARMLHDPDPVSRQLAAEALGLIGPEARAAVPALQEARKDSHPSVRAAVAFALDKIEPKK